MKRPLKNAFVTGLLMSVMTIALYGQHPLDAYLVRAAENHPDVKSSYSRYLAALEKIPQSGVLPDPRLSFGYFISPVETRVGSQRMKLSLSQMFPWIGTLGKEKSMAAEMAKARFEAFREVNRSLNLDISKQYFELVNLAVTGELIRDNIKLLQTVKNLATQRFENNQGTLVEVIQVGIRINTLENQAELNDELLATSKHNFNLTLGREPDAPVAIATTETLPQLLPDTSADFASHPSLKRLEHRIQSYHEGIQLAKLRGKPQIGVGFDYLVTDEISGVDVPKNGRNAFMPMMNISLPLFGNKYKAAAREAESLKQAQQHEYEAIKLDLATTYQRQQYQLTRARKEIALYDKQLTETQHVIYLLITTYESGKSSIEDLITMQMQQLGFQIARQNAIRDLNVSISELTYLADNKH